MTEDQRTFESYIREHPNTEGFFDVLERFRVQKGMKPVNLYRKAGITKAYYYKLRGRKYPNIAKERVVAFELALKLTRQEMDELLLGAGFALSKFSKFDLAVMFCLEQRLYDIEEIQKLIPRQYQNSVYVRRTGNDEAEEEPEADDSERITSFVDILDTLAERLEEFAEDIPWEKTEAGEDSEEGLTEEEEEMAEALAAPIVNVLDTLAEMFDDASNAISEQTGKRRRS